MIINTREQITELTGEWEGERLEDGRPKAQDYHLEKPHYMTLEEIWLPLYVKGYQFQYEGGLKYLHEGKELVGRAAACTFMPTRPDFYSVVKEKGDQNGWEGTCNQWVVDNLVEGDVAAADMSDKVFNGTFVGGDLTTTINTRTKAGGAVIWGGTRDIEQMSKIDIQAYFRGIHPASIRGCVITGYNIACRIGEAVRLLGDVVMGMPSRVSLIPSSCVAEVISSAEKTRARDISGFAMLEQDIYTTAEIDNSIWSTEMLNRMEALIRADERCRTYRIPDWTLERGAAEGGSETLKEILRYCFV